MTTKEAATSLGLTVLHVRRLCRLGKIEATTTISGYSIEPDAVERYRKETLGKVGNPNIANLNKKRPT